MASCKAFVWVVCFILFVELVTSQFISPEALKMNNVTDPHGRSMLQRHKRHGHHKHRRTIVVGLAAGLAVCKVNFDKVNYMPLRQQCRSPYRSGICCPALKRVACPYTNEINDVSSNCAIEMFIHINRFYPSGWFLQNCSEGPNGGLNCMI